MIINQRIIDTIFNEIGKTENCYFIDANLLDNERLKKFNKIIGISTEITFHGKCRDIKLYLALPHDLEVNLPQIFIDKESYGDLYYVPHINSDLSICVIDESENYSFNIGELPSVVQFLIKRSKEIIRSKENKEFIKKEFLREFKAYWEITYSHNDRIVENGLSLINQNDKNDIRGLKLQKKIGGYEYVIYNCELLFQKFKAYLDGKNIFYKEIPILFIKYDRCEPPFNLSYYDSLEYINQIPPHFVKRIINAAATRDVLVVFENSFNEFYGWTYPGFSYLQKGFRAKSNWDKMQLQFSRTVNVERLIFSNITPERMNLRTSGEVAEESKSVNLIGVGSVGSNLLHYLSKLPIINYNLVDKDILKVENVFRNDFGFDRIACTKAKIAKQNLLDKNPFIEVNIYEKDILRVIEKLPTFFNDVDYTFVAIGMTRIETYLLDYMKQNRSTKPVFFIWVEPYLASGQLLFMNPNDHEKTRDLIINFPYHVLNAADGLYIKEGSCQSGYYPYSETYLMLFLSSIFQNIYDIMIRKNSVSSRVFTWIGDLEYLKIKRLNIKEEVKNLESFKLYINEF